VATFEAANKSLRKLHEEIDVRRRSSCCYARLLTCPVSQADRVKDVMAEAADAVADTQQLVDLLSQPAAIDRPSDAAAAAAEAAELEEELRQLTMTAETEVNADSLQPRQRATGAQGGVSPTNPTGAGTASVSSAATRAAEPSFSVPQAAASPHAVPTDKPASTLCAIPS
jgi:hypothetical protein